MELLMVAVIAVYIVDVSGFTDSWRSLLARKIGAKSLRPLPPFDCGQCMTFWSCIVYLLVTGGTSIWTIAWTAVLSHLSVPIGQFLILAREAILALINRINDKIC